VDSVNDYQWYGTYSSIFTAPSLQVPWFSILGNHDYNGQPEAQIEYTKQHMDQRWTMPGHLFASIHTIPVGDEPIRSALLMPNSTIAMTSEGAISAEDAVVHVVYIDTLRLVPGEDIVTRPGGKQFVAPEVASAYLVAVEAMLAAGSSAQWLLVAGHYPIYSVADHGNTQSLIDLLTPLFKKYRVSAYFNGHDHVLQHIEHDGVAYFTSGHGTHSDNFPLGAYNARLRTEDDKIGYKFSRNGPGFAAVKATRSSLQVQFVDRWGELMYTTVLRRPFLERVRERVKAVRQGRHAASVLVIIGTLGVAAGLLFMWKTVVKVVNKLLPAPWRCQRKNATEEPPLGAVESGDLCSSGCSVYTPLEGGYSGTTVLLGAVGLVMMLYVYAYSSSNG
jgi:hypothetical protein